MRSARTSASMRSSPRCCPRTRPPRSPSCRVEGSRWPWSATGTYRKSLQNLTWAAGYNIVAIPLAAGVLQWAGITMPPAGGAVLMSVSTIVVAVNAQLLRRVDLRPVPVGDTSPGPASPSPDEAEGRATEPGREIGANDIG